MGIFLTILFLWFTYYFVTRFVLPLYITTKQVRKQFNDIKKQQEQYFNQQQPQSKEQPKQQTAQPKVKVGEYIDFEEVK